MSKFEVILFDFVFDDFVVEDIIIGDGFEVFVGNFVEVYYVGVVLSNGCEFDFFWNCGELLIF